ncbi:MAG: hypothetical protein ACOXZM_01630 [Eubacteriales bacterium]|jgi:ABC-type transport system substrate-binding protein
MLRHQRLTAVLAAAVAIPLLLTGCGSDPELSGLIDEARAAQHQATSTYARPQTERYIPAEQPLPGIAMTSGFTPSASDCVDGILARMLYTRLYTRAEDGSAVAELARVHSMTATEHRFSLDPDAAFFDGSPITVRDAAYSLNLSGFHASTDGNTLVVTDFPGNRAIAMRLADVPIVPFGTWHHTLPTASGDYCLRDGVVYDREEVACYTAVVCDSPRELLSAWQRGQIQSLTVDGSAPDAVFPHGAAHTETVGTRTLYALRFNPRRRMFAEADARLTAASALQRPELAGEWAQAAFVFVPSWCYLYTPAMEQEALEILDRHHGTLKGNAVLAVLDDAGYLTAMAEEIAQQLEEIGLKVEVKAYLREDYEAALGAWSWDMLLIREELEADFTTVLETEGCMTTPVAFAKARRYTHRS